MKKILSVLVITLVFVSLLTACGQNTSRQGNNAANNAANNVADNAEAMVDDAANTARSAVNSVTDAMTPDSNTNNNGFATANKGGQTSLEENPDTSNFVGEEKAKQIALDKAGLKATDVIFDRVKLERDDTTWVYEIEFKSQSAEYDAEIKAEDGTILEWEVDHNN